MTTATSLFEQVAERGRTPLLVAVGPDADRWLDVAQAFAGAPGRGSEA